MRTRHRRRATGVDVETATNAWLGLHVESIWVRKWLSLSPNSSVVHSMWSTATNMLSSAGDINANAIKCSAGLCVCLMTHDLKCSSTNGLRGHMVVLTRTDYADRIRRVRRATIDCRQRSAAWTAAALSAVPRRRRSCGGGGVRCVCLMRIVWQTHTRTH